MVDVLMSEVSKITGAEPQRDHGDIEPLKQSISELGLLQPLVINTDGTLVAGRRRYQAVSELGYSQVPVRIVNLDKLQQFKAAIEENTIRKNLTPAEEANAIAEYHRMKVVVEGEAKRGRPENNLSESDKLAPRTQTKTAAELKVRRPQVSEALALSERIAAHPEHAAELEKIPERAGLNRRLKELEREARHAEARETVAVADPATRWRLIHNHIGAVTEELEPESVDLIVTDPPYPKEFLPLYSALSILGEKALKPGGSLLCMCGQYHLSEVLKQVSSHLSYQWTLAYLTPGGQSPQIWPRKVNTFWKPVLWFVKGEYSGEWIGDVAKSAVNDNDKRFHDWGQSETGMADLVRRFATPGQTVLDPFCGGGTTGLVALSLDCYFIGADRSEEAITTSRRRLGGMAL